MYICHMYLWIVNIFPMKTWGTKSTSETVVFTDTSLNVSSYPGLPMFFNICEKIGKAWLVWHCLSCGNMMTMLIVWASGRRYAAASNYISRLTSPSWFFLCTLEHMGRLGYEANSNVLCYHIIMKTPLPTDGPEAVVNRLVCICHTLHVCQPGKQQERNWYSM